MIKHKILLSLSCFFLVLLIVFGIVFTNVNNELNDTTVLYKEMKSQQKNKEKSVYNNNDLKQLKDQLNQLKFEYNLLSSIENEAEKTAKEYIMARYCFDGSPVDNKDKIIDSVSDIITDSFKDTLTSTLSQSAAGNGFVSEDFKHTCKIISMFSSEIKEIGPSDEKDSEKYYKPSYMVDIYAKIEVNDTYTGICDVTLKKGENAEDCWKVEYEYIVATLFKEDFD